MSEQPERLSRPSNSLLAGTGSLVSNGTSLFINVIVSGFGGFVFWIVVANSASTQTLAEASALLTAMFGILTLSQQGLVANLPQLIASAPRPRRLAGQMYSTALLLTVVAAAAYVGLGPLLADGLEFLRDWRLVVLLFVSSLVWCVFALQDSVLTGLGKGHLVLAENTAWALTRLIAIGIAAAVGYRLSIAAIVATWIVPALLLSLLVSRFLFISAKSPLRAPLGTHTFGRRALATHLGFEQFTAISAGLTTIILPAVVLSAADADTAAAFLAALQFVVVSEGAMASLASAYGVEIRRAGTITDNVVKLTLSLLLAVSVGAAVLAQFFADDLMGLFGDQYRSPGGAALRVLVLGLPLRSLSMMSSATNRAFGAGWRNFIQQGAYAAALFASLALLPLSSSTSFAWCLFAARVAAAVVAIWHLTNSLRRHRTLPSGEPPQSGGSGS